MRLNGGSAAHDVNYPDSLLQRESKGFGLVAIEAAACGAFVIASEHSALTEVFQDTIDITVDAKDAEAWVSAIRAALAMSDEEHRFHAKAAQAGVDRCYRWPRVAEATLALFGKA